MIAPRLLGPAGLLLPILVACLPACPAFGGGSSEALDPLTSRLDATDQRLAAIETKLDQLGAKLDATTQTLAPVAAWVAAHPATEPQPPAPREDTPPVELDASDPSDAGLEGAAEGIECKGLETARIECTMDRALVDHLAADPTLLARQARVVPKQKDDAIVGYKLYGIRRDSLPKHLGLKNGDMVTAANGTPLGDLEQVMKVFTELRSAPRFEFDMVRRGAPLELVITLVE